MNGGILPPKTKPAFFFQLSCKLCLAEFEFGKSFLTPLNLSHKRWRWRPIASGGSQQIDHLIQCFVKGLHVLARFHGLPSELRMWVVPPTPGTCFVGFDSNGWNRIIS